jgi:hypothetical protein
MCIDSHHLNGTSASFSKLIDLNMLVMNGGRERTTAEFCALLNASDYKLTRIVPTMAPQSVIEAIGQLSSNQARVPNLACIPDNPAT